MMKVLDVDRLGTDLGFDDDGRLVPHMEESVEEMRVRLAHEPPSVFWYNRLHENDNSFSGGNVRDGGMVR